MTSFDDIRFQTIRDCVRTMRQELRDIQTLLKYSQEVDHNILTALDLNCQGIAVRLESVSELMATVTQETRQAHGIKEGNL